MRLVVWNCAQALHKKFDALRGLEPDVAVVAECARPDVAAAKAVYSTVPESRRAWLGDNRTKGLGVFTFGDYRVASSKKGPAKTQYALHVGIEGPRSFDLLAMWTQAPGYVENAHAALDTYRDVLGSGRAVLAGDLNSSAKFDKEHTPNHSALVRRLEDEFQMVSAYHLATAEKHGEETRPTHVHRLRKTKFHIDYAFVPESWPLGDIEVGAGEAWGSLSDHFPLVVEVEGG